jgi:hypothetical protein
VRGLRSFEAVAYWKASALTGTPAPRFLFLLSMDGTDWTAVPAANVQLSGGAATAAHDWVPYIYAIDDIQQVLPGASYIKVQWDSNAPGAAELSEARITFP